MNFTRTLIAAALLTGIVGSASLPAPEAESAAERPAWAPWQVSAPWPTPPARVAPSPPAGHAPTPPHVGREGGRWVVQAQGTPRGQLALQLARLSGTQLHAEASTLDSAAPVTVSLRTRSLADAWRAVLGDEFSHAVMCEAGNCRVWVMGLVPRQQRPAPTQGAAAGGPQVQPAAHPQQVFTSDPPGLFPSDPASADEKAAS